MANVNKEHALFPRPFCKGRGPTHFARGASRRIDLPQVEMRAVVIGVETFRKYAEAVGLVPEVA